MKKFIFIFYLVSCNLSSFSQSIYLDYNVRSVAEESKLDEIGKNQNVPNDIVRKFREAFNLISSMKMHLEANRRESLFWGDNNMTNDIDPDVYNMAKIMLGDDEVYRTSLTNGVIIKQVEAFGSTFLIEFFIDTLKWNYTTDKKKIGDYECLKATTEYVVSNSAGNFKKDVIAWYCPSITFNFGPKNFGGLPGLILELKDDKIIYEVETIKLFDKDLKIQEFKKGQILSNEEFQRMASQAIEERRNNFKKE